MLLPFFPPFVWLIVVKSKFKGVSYFPKLRFLASFFSFLRSIFHVKWGENSGKQNLVAENRTSADRFTPQGWPACTQLPFSPLQLLNSCQRGLSPPPAHAGGLWEVVRRLEGRSWGILFRSAMATTAVKGTGLVLCCSKWPGFSCYLATSAQHQTIWSPGKLKLGPPLPPFFDHIVGQEWTWGGSPEHGGMCTHQKHNDHRGRTGSVFSSVPQIQRSAFPDPCQHWSLKGWAPPKSLCRWPAGPAGGSSQESQGRP